LNICDFVVSPIQQGSQWCFEKQKKTSCCVTWSLKDNERAKLQATLELCSSTGR